MASKQTYWQTHLDAWRQSGLSQASYCKQRDLSVGVRYQPIVLKKSVEPAV
jgi:hypothetical protein